LPKTVPGQIGGLYRYIWLVVDQVGLHLDTAIKAIAGVQATILRESSPVIADALKKKQLWVVIVYHGCSSGKVSLLG
jgi:hypothetical protein